MTKLWIFSDPHYEQGNMLPAAIPEHDVCVIPGDLNSAEDAVNSLVGERVARYEDGSGWHLTGDGLPIDAVGAKPVVFTPGNHELWSVWQHIDMLGRKMEWLSRKSPFVHVLNPGSVEIAGVRFVGATLWTDYNLYGDPDAAMKAAASCMVDHQRISVAIEDGKRAMRRFTPQDALERHQRELKFICDSLATPFDGPTVVVTHHSPSAGSVPDRFQDDPLAPCFSSNLDWVCEKYAPAAWIHGHVHDSFDYMIGRTRVICNPAGYQREHNKKFRWDLVIDVDVPEPQPTKGFGL